MACQGHLGRIFCKGQGSEVPKIIMLLVLVKEVLVVRLWRALLRPYLVCGYWCYLIISGLSINIGRLSVESADWLY